MLYVKTDGKARVDKQSYTLDEARSFDSYGVLLEEGMIVIDADNKTAMRIINKRLNDEGIQTQTVITNNGMHFYFRNSSIKSNHTGYTCELGDLVSSDRDDKKPHGIDIKQGNKGTNYCIIKLNGIERVVMNEGKLADLPEWLKPLKIKFHVPSEEGNRNDFIYKTLRYDVCSKLNHDENKYKSMAYAINRYVFKEQLSEEELNTATRDYKIIELNGTLAYSCGELYYYDHDSNEWIFVPSGQKLTAIENYLHKSLSVNEIKDLELTFIDNRIPEPDVNCLYFKDKWINKYGEICDYKEGSLAPFGKSAYTIDELMSMDEPSNFSDLYKVITEEDLLSLITWLADGINKRNFCILHGEKNSYKSTLSQAIFNVLGNHSQYNFKHLFERFTMLQNTSGILFDDDMTIQTRGLDTGVFKKLYTGFATEVKNLKNSVNVPPKKFFGSCNSNKLSMGTSKLDSDAIYERMIMLKMCPPDEQLNLDWDEIGKYIVSWIISCKINKIKFRESDGSINTRKLSQMTAYDRFMREFLKLENINGIRFTEVKSIYNEVFPSGLWYGRTSEQCKKYLDQKLSNGKSVYDTRNNCFRSEGIGLYDRELRDDLVSELINKLKFN